MPEGAQQGLGTALTAIIHRLLFEIATSLSVESQDASVRVFFALLPENSI